MDTPYDMVRLVRLDTVESTQPEARSRFDGAPVLVSADRQTAGRGRSGNAWVHAPRAVAASLAFEPSWPGDSLAPLPLVAGLAACDVLDDRPALKWPNDLVAGMDKVGGIIVEARSGVVVVGLGVNLWWPEPIDGAAGLHQSDPGPEEPHRIARAWATRLLARAESGPDDWGRDEYARRCVTLGSDVVWEGSPGACRALGIAPDGALEVATPVGPSVVRAGEVTAIRSAPRA
jgi:BirA family biotin operon repressor/biotin-[acetyl-CoA-carboxylase] ligase